MRDGIYFIAIDDRIVKRGIKSVLSTRAIDGIITYLRWSTRPGWLPVCWLPLRHANLPDTLLIWDLYVQVVPPVEVGKERHD
jgi:hypothetical protein